ncbi:unnamed protein product [Schistosoma mattheei]|uniref:dihydrofolate reductase n=1 Tax=Schistosoma mattheei TaxID=31246 RepID=A0A183PH84_9TREM|nr:unnamed protein product [Schistosoma mattheei]
MRLNVVVAVSENWGIGKCGGLPWKIKKDMEFFKSVTTKAHPVIPTYNLPILSSAPPRVQIVPNLNAAIDLLYNEEFSSIVDEVFIIGGHRLYEVSWILCPILYL